LRTADERIVGGNVGEELVELGVVLGRGLVDVDQALWHRRRLGLGAAGLLALAGRRRARLQRGRQTIARIAVDIAGHARAVVDDSGIPRRVGWQAEGGKVDAEDVLGQDLGDGAERRGHGRGGFVASLGKWTAEDVELLRLRRGSTKDGFGCDACQ
jgi:hypothetical protein